MTSTSVAITNPLVLYRSLISTGKLLPNPSQHRLALHLQKLYTRLKDYEPTATYSNRLRQINSTLNKNADIRLGKKSLLQFFLEEKIRRDTLSLTRTLTNHEEAMSLDSPKGLLVHGEVGTGKSMLIDLFATCLPTGKKRRYHYSTFMLDTIARLEQHRKTTATVTTAEPADYSLFWLATDLIRSSPILFLDEFQLPDRMAAKTLSSLFTIFFQLGGVLVATSNRMPDELAKAAGVEYARPPSRMESLRWKLGMADAPRAGVRGLAGRGEFADFLELLKTRCEVWEMEGKTDYRRSGEEINLHVSGSLPPFYVLGNMADAEGQSQLARGLGIGPTTLQGATWTPFEITVYGRVLRAPRTLDGVAWFTFDELCLTRLGPADYVSLASIFHTFIISDVPILTTTLKNEARRLISLLDALYEARCKLMVSASASPDDLFFPETNQAGPEPDAIHPETYSEVHQDLTAPFRPNVSPYTAGLEPTPSSSIKEQLLPQDALEDDPPPQLRRGRTPRSIRRATAQATPAPGRDFSSTAAFTGEDERFACRRAASRLWEMCGAKWWARRGEGWWKPVPKEARSWEGSRLGSALEPRNGLVARGTVGRAPGSGGDVEWTFADGTARPRPRKIARDHVWGMGEWGPRAGGWGQGARKGERK